MLKDTRDTVFVFMSLVVGMAVGSQRYLIAIVGTVAMMLVVYYLNLTSFGSDRRYDGYLTLRLSDESARSEFARMLNLFCKRIKQVSTRQTGDDLESEFVYQIGLRDRQRGGELIERLRGMDGISHVSLVVRDELSEV